MPCHCGGTDIEYNQSRGDATCMSCGAVLSENQIVTDLSFVQDAAGSSSMVGQFVPASGPVPLGAGARQQRGGKLYTTESREVTIARGRARIQHVAMLLQMTRHHCEAANRLFMLAIQHNFIQGRKTDHVVAACLYIVCRREKTQHLLIDFSDVLQTNVFILGKTFMKFVRLLNISMPIIDPSLFVHRFAARLEFDDKTHLVAMTALRLVSRMRRDWMAVGICGASLIIAARLHGFRRSQKEVGRIVKICEATLRKRILEFIETPSAYQTVSEFNATPDDFAAEMDPPSFRAAHRFVQRHEVKNVSSDDSEDAGAEDIDEDELQSEMQKVLNSNEMNELSRELAADVSQTPPVPSTTGGEPAASENAAASAESPTAAVFANKGTGDVDGGTNSGDDGSDDEEIDQMLLSVNEQASKEKVWLEINKEYLQQQEAKLKWEQEQLAMGIEPDSTRRRKRKRREVSAETPAEATMNALASTRQSSKINYDVLKDLFDSSTLLSSAAHPNTAAERDGAAVDEDDIVEDGDDVPDEVEDHEESRTLRQQLVGGDADRYDEDLGDYYDDDDE
ncbi:hypothetical protein PBRA_001125 [Plasmodiophora brassicae]|uniref:B-related factor 1 n=1 Tax=Plasmodiophora brassicae TaxID=37360 RepID=A0A0G4IVB3_PLABS|nr:hypothetical protein PBRA_001125 [Plasmodiophora brassicae]